MRMWLGYAVICCVATLVPSAARADGTEYGYDALGRLRSSSNSSGTNAGIVSSMNYDPAGNRSGYAVSGSSVNGQAIARTSSLKSAGTSPQAANANLPTVTVPPAGEDMFVLRAFICGGGGSGLVGVEQVSCNP